MADCVRGHYLSLPQYERCFQMPRVHHDPPYEAEHATYMKDQVEEMVAEVYTAQERMFDDFCRKLDATYYPLNNNIGWLSKFMEELAESGLHSFHYHRQQKQITKRE